MNEQPTHPFYPFKIFLGIIGYLGYFASAGIFFCVGLPFFAVLALWPGPMRRVMYSVLRNYAVFLTRIWLPMLQVYDFAERPGPEASALRGSIIVANHRSRLDALMMLSVLPESGVVIKSKYTGVPLYSAFVKYLDFVSIDSGSLASLASALEKCKDVLARGKNLLVFPEGTRARTGKLLPFGQFSFKLAMETHAPLVPAIIHSNLPLMARCRGSIFPRYRFRYTVRFLPPERAGAGETAQDFASRVRAIMTAELAPLDKGTCWDTGKKDIV
jgi:1-acyl-sn-glycerol-3-phosphate acyltransferase